MERIKFLAFLMSVIVLIISGCGSDSSSPDSYTVKYNANEATQGIVPTDAINYSDGQQITISGNTGNLLKTGNVFSGWCVNADSTGTAYSQGDTLTMESSNVTLYAKWTVPPIDFTPKIGISRSSGELPFHVYISASDSIWDGVVTHPYDQMEFSWNFGDTESDNSFTHPVTNATVQANTDQTGPEASFIYRKSGDYTITLTASYKDISNDKIYTAQASIIVNVNEWSGATRYFDPSDGGDNNTGETTESPWQTWGKLVDWLADGDNRKALIKRDTQMSVDETLWLSNSHVRIGDYGTGAKPVLIASEVIGSIIRLRSDDLVEDHVYYNLSLNGNNGNARSIIYTLVSEANTELKGLALVDLVFENNDPHGAEDLAANLISIQNNNPDAYVEDILVWNGEFIRNRCPKNGIYAEFQKYFAVIGGSFTGGEGNSIKDHPIYPATVQHALYRWIDF